MKLRSIFRFEVAHQLHRLPTWLYFSALLLVAFLFVRGNFLADALYADFYLNSPFVIAGVTVFGSLFWFVVAAPVAGDAAARDAETGMHPLAYTAPVRKLDYLAGRFLAAFFVNSLILLAVPAGILIAVHAPGVDAAIVGPFRPAAYLTAYGFIALPNVFAGSAIQFSWAALSRRGIASYLGSILLLFVTYGGFILTAFYLERGDLAALLDVFGHFFITSDLVLGWTALEKSTRLIELEGALLWSRLLWFGIALGSLAFTYARFRLAHPPLSPAWTRLVRALRGPGADAGDARAPTAGSTSVESPILLPPAEQTFDLATRTRQTFRITRTSFRTISTGRGGLVVLAAMALLVVVLLPENMENMGTPLLPRTEYVLTFLTAPLSSPVTPWVVIPLLTVLWAGELVWRERDAGLGEITDAAAVPESVTFLGKFLGLSLVLLVWMGFLTIAGLLVQLRLGYDRFEIGLYLQVLLGLQLPEYLLFAALALAVQGIVGQKYVGHLVTLLLYAYILFASRLGIQHDLLVYGSSPAWSYTDMRGFGASVAPWLWFKLYWAAWALLLGVAATLLWVRGLERSLRARLELARLRWTQPTSRMAAAAAGLLLLLGTIIFYNTNVLNEYVTESDIRQRRAEYEQRYGRYAGIVQPELRDIELQVEIYPRRRELEIRGTYELANTSTATIDSIHVATIPGVETGAITFDRGAAQVLLDVERGHRIYDLDVPLRPGDRVKLRFGVQVEAEGFSNSGIGQTVAEKSTFFRSRSLLPAIGYQSSRELMIPGQRREHGLAARPLFPTLAGAESGRDITGEDGTATQGAARINFAAVVGTDADQIAVAPGTLRRTWTESGRRYFHYASDVPVGDEQTIASAAYAVHEEVWRPPSSGGAAAPEAVADDGPVAIQVYFHPRHAANVPRMLRSVRASLDRYSEKFGPYRHDYLRLVENPGRGIGAHADVTTIDYTEGFSRFDPKVDERSLDLPFAVIAHETAHLWGVPYAYAEGAPLLSESFAWYAAMGVVEESYGRDHLRRLLRFFRQPNPIPPIQQSVPLLRAMDPYAAYRKGPFALYALGEYMGEERVNLAFRRLREKHASEAPLLATSLDLYRELQAVTPDSLRGLLHDLFAANTVWELATERAAGERTPDGNWRVTLDIRARKLVVDSAGGEREVPMDEWIDIGIFAPTGPGADFGEELYLRKHRIRSGEQAITITVPREPSDAGIDPYHLLIDPERFDNVEEVDVSS